MKFALSRLSKLITRWFRTEQLTLMELLSEWEDKYLECVCAHGWDEDVREREIRVNRCNKQWREGSAGVDGVSQCVCAESQSELTITREQENARARIVKSAPRWTWRLTPRSTGAEMSCGAVARAKMKSGREERMCTKQQLQDVAQCSDKCSRNSKACAPSTKDVLHFRSIAKWLAKCTHLAPSIARLSLLLCTLPYSHWSLHTQYYHLAWVYLSSKVLHLTSLVDNIWLILWNTLLFQAHLSSSGSAKGYYLSQHQFPF